MSNIQCDDIKCKDITADDIKINSKSIFDLIYPVGSIYISVTNLDPNIAFPGTTWTKLQGGYALVTTDNNSPNMSMEDASNHIPGEAAQGGLPNITGRFSFTDNDATYMRVRVAEANGAFYSTNYNNNYVSSDGVPGAITSASVVDINPSRQWNNYGMYQSNVSNNNGRVIPDHIAVVVWKRES